MISIFSNIFKYFYRVEVLILLFLIFSISVSALVADTSGTQPQEEPAPQEEVAPTPEPVPDPVPDPAPQEEEESNENIEEVVEEESEEPQTEEKPQKATVKQSSNSEEETTEVEETEEEEKEITEQEEVEEEELTPDPASQESTPQESAPAPKETAPQQQSSPPAPQNGGASAEAEEVYICNEEEIIWGSAGQCSAVVPQGQGGDSPTLTTIDNTNPNFNGQATIACIDNIGWIQDSNPIVTYCNPIETAQEPTTEEVVEEKASAPQQTATGETSHTCDGEVVYWGITDRMCSADIADGNNGETSTVEDTTSPIIGSATFTCNADGSWNPDTTVTSTCTDEVFSNFGESVATDGTRTIIRGSTGVHIYNTINADGTLGDKVLLPTISNTQVSGSSRQNATVAISGNYAIVGAPFDDNERGARAGSAYIYERVGGNWSDPIPLTLPRSTDGDASDDTGLESGGRFGQAVAIDGSYAIVGAPRDHNDRGTVAGSAYIYERTSSGWVDPIHLPLPNIDGDGSDDTGLELDSGFGNSVSISGNYAIVGAPFDDNERGGNAGSAYIYERTSSGWGTPIAIKLPTELESRDLFGISLAIDGNNIIVGASGTHQVIMGAGAINVGEAYSYKRVNGVWSNSVKLTLPNGLVQRNRFGHSVSISGDYAIIGAPFTLSVIPKPITGSAYIYERAGDEWGQPIPITLLDTSRGTTDTGLELGSGFGNSVAISGNYAIVGAFEDDNELGTDAGSAYTYNRASARDWDLLASTTRTATLAFAGCGAVTGQRWTVGGRTCSANLVASGHGDMTSLDSITTGFGGSATFTCNNRIWEIDQSTATCATEGSLSVNISPGIEELISVGENGVDQVVIGTIEFEAGDEDITIEELTITIAEPTRDSGSVIDAIRLFNGSTQVDRETSIPSDGEIEFDSVNFDVEDGRTEELEVRVDLRGIDADSTGVAAQEVTLQLVANSVKASGANKITEGSIRGDETTQDVGTIYTHRAVPEFATVTGGVDATLIDGDIDLYAFSVTAPAEGDVSIQSVAFESSLSGGAALGTVRLFAYEDISFNDAITGLTGDDGLASEVTGNKTSGTAYTVDFGDEPVTIDAGETVYFQLEGVVGGVLEDSNIRTRLVSDSEGIDSAGSAATDSSLANARLVWSPHSSGSGNVEVADTDWFSGEGVILGDKLDSISVERTVSNCTAGPINWGPTGRVCNGNISAGNHAATSTVADTTSPIIGSATFTCNDGTWIADPSSTCTNEVFNRFGRSVATDGTTTIVGSGGNGNGEGIHIYETINPDGTLGGRVLLPTTDDIDQISDLGYSVAIDGDYAIVGARDDDNERGTNAGSAYIYERDSATGWGNPIPLTLPTDLEVGSQFGISVSIDGEYAIVGANIDDNGEGRNAGSAYIYERDSATGWGNPIPLTLPTDLEVGSQFGFSASISEDYAIVGANTDDNGEGTNAGSAYIYKRVDDEDWGNPTPLTLPNGLEVNSFFGHSVAIDGDYAIVGALGDDNGEGRNVGSAYIYERVESRTGPNKWGNPISLTLPTGLESASSFGSSVSINGNYAIVGAYFDDSDIDGDGTPDRGVGSAYIYERNGDGWNNPIALTLPMIDNDGSNDTGLEANSRFGNSVSISGNYAVIVAFGDNNEIGNEEGTAYTYNRASAKKLGSIGKYDKDSNTSICRL